MLCRQPEPICLTGGLEAARLQEWHIDELLRLRLRSLFLAYDTPDDYEPLRIAAKMLRDAGLITRAHKVRCYVLIGYPGDVFNDAEKRLQAVCDLGLMPFAMLYRDRTGKRDRDWMSFRRLWYDPRMVGARISA